MSNKETEQLVASAFHMMRSAAKKQRKRDRFAEEREAARRIAEQYHSRFSIYPPGWEWPED